MIHIDKETLFNWYANEKRSYRWIMKQLNCNSARSIKRLLDLYEIPIRYGSEAVKTQWINNQERKEKTAKRAKKTFAPYRNLPMREETKAKIGLANKGDKNGMHGRVKEKHPNWMGGKNNWDKDRKMTKNKRKQVFDTLGKVCRKCGETDFSKLTINHIVPWRISKSHDIKNLEVLCKHCHFSQPARLR